jgi:hypothetical protein
MIALLRKIQESVQSIELPLVPGFHEVNACREAGIIAEYRHTHLLDLIGNFRSHYAPAVRNHIRSAEAVVTILMSEGARDFCFERAIVAQPDSHVDLRARFAYVLSRVAHVTCLTALVMGKRVGQGLVVTDNRTSYYLHSWFDRNGPRGVPSLLIDCAMSTSRESSVVHFDLEGSIIPSVDRFMTGFGAFQAPYAHLLWHREPGRICELMLKNLEPGPMVSDSPMHPRPHQTEEIIDA